MQRMARRLRIGETGRVDGFVCVCVLFRLLRSKSESKKAKRTYQRGRARNVRAAKGGRSWAQVPQSVEVQGELSNRLDISWAVVWGRNRTTASRSTEAFDVLAIPHPHSKRVSRNGQYMALQRRHVCWANADRARAHLCGLVVCRRTWPARSRFLSEEGPGAYVRRQRILYGARSLKIQT